MADRRRRLHRHTEIHCFTAAQGTAAAAHAVEANYRFDVQQGRVPARRGVTKSVKPQGTLTFTLARAKPLRGVVVAADGKPVAAAKIRQYAKFMLVGSTNASYLNGQSGPVVAVTDTQGRFVLDELLDGAAYALLISSKDHGRHLVRDVAAGQGNLRIALGPELTVSGTIRGDLHRLTKQDGKPAVTYGQRVSFPSHRSRPAKEERRRSSQSPAEASSPCAAFCLAS